MSDTPDRALELLGDVLDAPADQRAALLDRACAGDSRLRGEVERLLEVGLGPKADQILRALEPPTTTGAPSAAAADVPRFGRYRVVRVIGEGGMGSVYEAEQDDPRRRVALKVIKPGMDSRRVIARFAAEREALALMDHPNIARVFDAGVAEGGRPFFVMELVEGQPITAYCDDEALSVRDRLELFLSVCRAVQHAHQKGIIHRDLKPSNVLVSAIDGRPVPKVIDFGIAKAMGGRGLTGQTLLTECAEWVGTPEYMSPEQAGAAAGDVDTRGDVYSLGVLLYELLTGTTPFDRKLLRVFSQDEVRRLIREADPPKPSTRLLEGHAVAARAGARDAAARARTVRGELDWIVMKCLEKDRARRYETANELAADLGRHLRYEPVHAGPPSKTYRVRKFVRRNRAPLAAASAMAVLLISGVAGSTVGLVRAKAAEARAMQEADQVAALNNFLVDIFGAARPIDGGGRHVTVAELLDRAARSLPAKFHNQPEAEMQARAMLGGTYGLLGHRNAAVAQHTLAYELAGRLYGPDDPRTLEQGAKLAHWIIAEPETQAERDRGHALAAGVRAAAEKTLGEASDIYWLASHQEGYALQIKGDYAGAERIYRRLVETWRRFPSADNLKGKSNPYYGLGWALWGLKSLDEAEAMLGEAIRLHVASGDDSPRDQMVMLRVLGFIRRDKGHLEDAARTFQEALVGERELGHRFPTVERVTQDALDVLVRLKKFDDAVGLARRRLEQAGADIPSDPALVVDRTERLIHLLVLAGRREDAKALRARYRDAAEALVRLPPDTRPATLRRAKALANLGRLRDAAADYARCIDLDATQHDAWLARAWVLAYAGDRDAYEIHCRRMLERYGQATSRTIAERTGKAALLLPQPPDLTKAAVALADLAVGHEQEGPLLPWFHLCKGLAKIRTGDFHAAIEWLGRARADAPPAPETPAPEAVAMIDLLLAIAHHHQGEPGAARAAFDRASRIVEREWGPASAGTTADFQVLTIYREARALISAEGRASQAGHQGGLDGPGAGTAAEPGIGEKDLDWATEARGAR